MSEQLDSAPHPTTSDPVAFARAVEQLPIGVLAYHGPDHMIIGANQEARAFFGHRHGIVGRTLRDMFPEIVGQHVLEQLDRVYATGDPFTATEWRIVVDGPDGGDERFVNFVLVGVREPDGTVSGVTGWFADVTESVLKRRSHEFDTADLRERFEAAQDTVLTLQRSLLPAGLPVLAGVRIAAHYLVAGAEQAAGGDWFEAVPLGGRVAAIVGDVVGHGAQASAVMGQLRAVMVEFLLDGEDLTSVLARLDRFAGRVPGARGATVCIALIDRATGVTNYVCAGHPPPLVVAADGATRYLPAPGGGPLGVAGPAPMIGSTELAAGDLLLCFSDGLVERPGQALTAGLAELADVASHAMRVGTPSLLSADATDRVAELTVERMTRQGYHDDVTVLAVQRTGDVVADFAVELPAEPGQLSVLRRRLEGWLTDVGAGEMDVASIEIAVLEAVTNSVEHAYTEPGGTVRVDGVLDDQGRVCITVADGGRWRPASADPGRRGRGLLMMRGCVDTVEVDAGDDGTVVQLDRELRRRPVVSPAQRSTDARQPEPAHAMTVVVEASDVPRIALGGPIDLSTAEDLRRELWSASRGGALPLVVDLDGVTHLASAGIQVLYDFVEEMTIDGRAVRFVVPSTSPAWHALTVSNLDQVVAVTQV